MTYTVPPGRYSDVNSAFVQAYIDAAIAGVVDLAPETLNSLNELAAAINDDPNYFATVGAQVAELNADVVSVVTALGVAEDDTSMGSFTADVLPDASDLKAVLEAFALAWQTAKDNIETEAANLSGRLDTLELDPTTAAAVAAVQSDVDQNETDSDSADAALSGRLDVLEADPTTATAVAAVQADVDQNESDGDAADAALSGRLDVLEADPTTATAVAAVQADVDQNELDGDAADAALSGRLDVLEADPTTAAAVAAVQADVDQNETDSDAADAALSGRLDVLEADPTTATAVAAVQSDVDQNEADADAAIALKLDIASPAATGQLTVDTNARLQFDSNLTKVENVLRGTAINIGNNIEMRPAAPGGRVEVVGGFHIDITEVPEYSNDSQAAAGGIVVGGIYRSGSVLHIRVS